MPDEIQNTDPILPPAETDPIEPAAAETIIEEKTPAAERLRAFEDEHLGAEAPRIEGKVERGHGSPFSRMSDEDKAKYDALEKLVAAEAKLTAAREALALAEEEYAVVEAAADAW